MDFPPNRPGGAEPAVESLLCRDKQFCFQQSKSCWCPLTAEALQVLHVQGSAVDGISLIIKVSFFYLWLDFISTLCSCMLVFRSDWWPARKTCLWRPPTGVCGAEWAHYGQEPGDAVEGDGPLDQVWGGRGGGNGPLGEASRGFAVFPQFAGAQKDHLARYLRGNGEAGALVTGLVLTELHVCSQGRCCWTWTRRPCLGSPTRWWSRWSFLTRSKLRTEPTSWEPCCWNTGDRKCCRQLPVDVCYSFTTDTLDPIIIFLLNQSVLVQFSIILIVL